MFSRTAKTVKTVMKATPLTLTLQSLLSWQKSEDPPKKNKDFPLCRTLGILGDQKRTKKNKENRKSGKTQKARKKKTKQKQGLEGQGNLNPPFLDLEKFGRFAAKSTLQGSALDYTLTLISSEKQAEQTGKIHSNLILPFRFDSLPQA